MDKRYLVFKCCSDGQKKAITLLTAYDIDEAREALRWLQKHHEHDMNFKLSEGEFFEILEESHIPPGEWQEAMVQLKAKR